MMKYSPIQGVTLVGLSLLLTGCDRPQNTPPISVEELTASLRAATLETEAAVERVVSIAAASERAVMFVHVDWAIMGPQRTRFAEFMRDYNRSHPGNNLGFYYVDCTAITSGYAPLTKLPGWAELEAAAGTSLLHGYGELVWLERGRVVGVKQILSFATTAELMQETERLMSAKN
jgi:hypothetical protein